MLRADANIDSRAVRHTGGKELAEGRVGQRPAHFAPDHVDIAKECRRLAINRRVVNVVRRAALHDPAIAHQRNLVRHAHRLARLVGDQQHGGAFGLEHVQGFIPDVIAQTVIKTGKRLVHQHDFGPRRKGAGQCNALLLAARQLVREAVDMAAHADFAQQFFDAGAGSAAVKFEAESHVLRDAEVRKQGEILKHQTDRPRFRRHVAPVAAN